MSDPHFDNVVIGCHFDETHGTTTFVDIKGGTLVAQGSTATSNVQSKFGGLSCRIPPSSYLVLPTSSELSFAGDFTVDLHVYNLSSSTCLFSDSSVAWFYNDQLRFNSEIILSEMGLSYGASWTYLEIGRASGVVYVRQNGTLKQSAPYSGTISFSGMDFGRYRPNNNLFLDGYIDDLRITKNVARQATSTPTEAFSNDGFSVEAGVATISAAAEVSGVTQAILYATATAESGTDALAVSQSSAFSKGTVKAKAVAYGAAGPTLPTRGFVSAFARLSGKPQSLATGVATVSAGATTPGVSRAISQSEGVVSAGATIPANGLVVLLAQGGAPAGAAMQGDGALFNYGIGVTSAGAAAAGASGFSTIQLVEVPDGASVVTVFKRERTIHVQH